MGGGSGRPRVPGLVARVSDLVREASTAAAEGAGRGVLLIAAGVMVFAVVSVGFLVGLVRAPASGMIDLAVYRWGGQLAMHGTRLYRLRYHGFLPFTYPPAAALAFIPLAALSLREIDGLSAVVGVLALVATVWVCFGSLGWKRHADRVALTLVVSGAAMCLEPVRQTFRFGQVNLILLAIVVADLCLPDSSRCKGIGVGLAAGFKLTPLIFVPYLLLTRRVSAGARALGSFCATIALGFLVMPVESNQFWFGHIFANPARVGGLAYVSNQITRTCSGAPARRQRSSPRAVAGRGVGHLRGRHGRGGPTTRSRARTRRDRAVWPHRPAHLPNLMVPPLGLGHPRSGGGRRCRVATGGADLDRRGRDPGRLPRNRSPRLDLVRARHTRPGTGLDSVPMARRQSVRADRADRDAHRGRMARTRHHPNG